MPCSFNVAFDPFFYGVDVGGSILEVRANSRGLGGGDEGGVGGGAGLGLDGPGAVLDAGGKMVGAAIGFGVGEVEVLGCGGGVVGEEAGYVDSVRLVCTHARELRRKGAKWDGGRLTDACR